MTTGSDDEYFDRRWLHPTTKDHQVAAPLNLNDIRDFAYSSFDRLDLDGNGFISRSELLHAMEHGNLGHRELSFVMFLLNNQSQIEEMFDDGDGDVPLGISRQDIEVYFKVIADLLA